VTPRVMSLRVTSNAVSMSKKTGCRRKDIIQAVMNCIIMVRVGNPVVIHPLGTVVIQH
jgi:hypothetical protein